MECEIYRVNNNLCSFSPCGGFFAIAYQSNLIVKKTATLETLHSYVFADIIEVNFSRLPFSTLTADAL